MTKNDYGTKENIKRNIRNFREKNNFTQIQLAQIMGTDRSTYTKWESGVSMPNIIQLSMLASIYRRSVEDFYKTESGFTVATPQFDKEDDSSYLSTLTSEEKMLIAEYRTFNEEEKKKLNDSIGKLKSDHNKNEIV